MKVKRTIITCSYDSECHLALANSSFSGQIKPAVFVSKFRSNSWRHIGAITFGVLSSARAILRLGKKYRKFYEWV